MTLGSCLSSSRLIISRLFHKRITLYVYSCYPILSEKEQSSRLRFVLWLHTVKKNLVYVLFSTGRALKPGFPYLVYIVAFFSL